MSGRQDASKFQIIRIWCTLSVSHSQGNYERYLDVSLTKDHNITTGKVYKSVNRPRAERRLLGKTVPGGTHITNEIMDWIERVALVPVDSENYS